MQLSGDTALKTVPVSGCIGHCAQAGAYACLSRSFESSMAWMSWVMTALDQKTNAWLAEECGLMQSKPCKQVCEAA